MTGSRNLTGIPAVGDWMPGRHRSSSSLRFRSLVDCGSISRKLNKGLPQRSSDFTAIMASGIAYSKFELDMLLCLAGNEAAVLSG